MREHRTISVRDLGISAAIPLPKRTDWRIGLVGFGNIATSHVHAYKAAGWKVVAVADPDPIARSRAAETIPGVKLHEDYRELVADSAVEVVSLLTQPAFREPAVAAAAEAGKPILTEKPLGSSLDECERLVAIAEQAGIRLAVNQNYRWAPANYMAKQIIDKGLIGTPFYACIVIYGEQDRTMAEHPYYSRCPDFLTVEWNTHLADLFRYWLGRDAKRVFACTRRSPKQRFASDNLLISICDFGDGCTGHIVHSELVRSSLCELRCRIDGDRGTIEFDLYRSDIRMESEILGAGPFELEPVECLPSMCGSMGDLLISIEEGRDPQVSARRNVMTIRQVLAERDSARAGGAWVTL